MSEIKASKLQFYSLGVVAVNKELSSKIIEVTPVEDFPMLDGEITDHTVPYKADFQNASQEKFSSDINTSVTVKATWLPISNSNRVTAPDVRRGEKVVIYRFADTDQYWWGTLLNDTKLRRLETVIYAFSDNREENVEDTASSTYFLEVSTHRKLVHLHTSKSDEEPFAYDVQINAKDGIVTITDDVGNYFVLNSRDTQVIAKNADGTFIDLNKTNITISADESITINTKSLSINASTRADIVSPQTGCSEKVTIGGELKVTGNSSLGGGGTVVGDVDIEGKLTVSETVYADNFVEQ